MSIHSEEEYERYDLMNECADADEDDGWCTAKVDYNGQAVHARVRVEAECDPNYGADADGNRGIMMRWVEIVEIDKDSIEIDDDGDVFAYLPEDVQEAIELAITERGQIPERGY